MVTLVVVIQAQPVSAKGRVGSGTPDSCTGLALDTALARGGKVTFNCGSSPVTITLTSYKIIARSTWIDGAGRVTLTSGGTMGIFVVRPKVTLRLTNIEIAGGVAESGAGVYNQGTLRVNRATFSDNTARSLGGAIYNEGRLWITDSMLSSNAAMSGGGIYNVGTLTASRCTFSGNRASGGADGSVVGIGGGIAGLQGRMRVEQSTFSANSAVDLGGGIYNGGTLDVLNSTLSENDVNGVGGGLGTVGGTVTLTNSTLANNGAGAYAGGIYASDARFGATVTLQNTIVVNNRRGNCAGPITDGGNNLQFPAMDCGATVQRADPLLEQTGLAPNGGATETIALRPGSPAINAGNQALCEGTMIRDVDQRGFTRPGLANVNCSIGAYEFNSPGAGR